MTQRISGAVLMSLLVTLNSSAFAAWLTIGSNERGILYISRDTHSNRGSTVKVWELTDFRDPQLIRGERSLSASYEVEYDCAEARSRNLYLYFHSSAMGGGEIVSRSSQQREWVPIPPDTLDWIKLTTVCGKR